MCGSRRPQAGNAAPRDPACSGWRSGRSLILGGKGRRCRGEGSVRQSLAGAQAPEHTQPPTAEGEPVESSLAAETSPVPDLGVGWMSTFWLDGGGSLGERRPVRRLVPHSPGQGQRGANINWHQPCASRARNPLCALIRVSQPYTLGHYVLVPVLWRRKWKQGG